MKNTSLIVSAVLWLCSCLSMMAAGNKVYVVQSPDKQLKVEISAGTDGLIYSVYHKDSLIVVDSKLGLIQEGKTPALAGGAKVISAKTKKIFQDIDTPFYRFKSFQAVCNEMNLKLKGEYGVYFRVYNEGVAYRFYTSSKEDLIIKNEIAEFRFAGNYTAYLPYSTNKEKPMAMAFQNTYEVKPLSEAPQELAFLPVTVDCKQAKVTLLESDLEAYPGMFVQPDGKQALKGVFAPYPKKTDFYPWRKQEYVTEAENYIARVKGNRMYPWRILAITEKDTEMPVNNLVYALASPNRIGDCSWVKPGKVAWDWWNDWNLKGVSFKAGINMDTYKYYIDFASRNGLEYVVLDEGWYDPKSGDMLTVIPELDLPEYAHICNTPENIAFWNKRARGFGGAPEDDFSASCGEENVLAFPGDKYVGENILIHEFAHLFHTIGIVGVEPDFNDRLEKCRQNAIAKGLWKDTYAISNKEEYFAECVQSFFNCNRYSETPNKVHNAMNRRTKLKSYDPDMYQLLKEYFYEIEIPILNEVHP